MNSSQDSAEKTVDIQKRGSPIEDVDDVVLNHRNRAEPSVTWDWQRNWPLVWDRGSLTIKGGEECGL
jgi:hypothetical protein